MSEIDPAALPPAATDPDGFAARAAAVVAAADQLRQDHPAIHEDDLDDPWGRGDQTFQRVGDEIEDTTVPFATLLLP